MESGAKVLKDGPIRLEAMEDGAIWRAVLNTPKANILDMQKSDILSDIFAEAATAKDLKAVVIEGEGPHFSFGASVQEHLPDRIEAMLTGFHRLFYRMLDSNVVTLAAVRGQCLGGGMELATFCHRLFASPDARLGQPEIVLGVLAPVASVMLAERIGRGQAEELCLSGRSVTADEGLAMGLVDQVDPDPGAAALAWARTHILPRSASSLRMAVRAVRVGFATRFRAELAAVEHLFLQDLMATADAKEGLHAFLEKREPGWKNE